MAETYLEITRQIEALRQKAETIRESEIAGVIDRIKTAIEAYGLTADQLFDMPAAPRKSTNRPEPARRASAKGRSGPRFRDDAGHSWSGRGPRPRWIKAALAEGKSLEDFAVDSRGPETAPEATVRPAAKAPVSAPKYKDGEGHSWSGRGPRPGWVKAALEAGKTLEDLS